MLPSSQVLVEFMKTRPEGKIVPHAEQTAGNSGIGFTVTWSLTHRPLGRGVVIMPVSIEGTVGQ